MKILNNVALNASRSPSDGSILCLFYLFLSNVHVTVKDPILYILTLLFFNHSPTAFKRDCEREMYPFTRHPAARGFLIPSLIFFFALALNETRAIFFKKKIIFHAHCVCSCKSDSFISVFVLLPSLRYILMMFISIHQMCAVSVIILWLSYKV